jgi:S-adenosylmethionine/arginine decarboxylase-like enzyme
MTRGRHRVALWQGCDPALLGDPARLVPRLERAVERVGGPIRGRLVQPGDDAVTVVVQGDAARLVLHARPSAGSAAVDLYTWGPGDPGAALMALERDLGARASSAVDVDRGLEGAALSQVEGHRRVATYTLDARPERLPPELVVGHSRGRGLGLFATRAFQTDAPLHRAVVRFIEWDADITVLSALGATRRWAYDLCPELGESFIEDWPPTLRADVARAHQLPDASPQAVLAALTDGLARESLFSGLCGLINHSATPNTALDFSKVLVGLDADSRPRWEIPLHALRPISAGEELLRDYSATCHDFVAEDDWQP